MEEDPTSATFRRFDGPSTIAADHRARCGKNGAPVLRPWHKSERGISLVIAAGALVMILGMAGLAVDVGFLYVVRNEAQRSADAAALAGATVFVSSGCTATRSCSDATVQLLASTQAITIGNQNLVGGQSPNIASGDITFDTSVATDPRITVTVQRTAAHGNAVPTLFAKILGFQTVDIKTSATAEAYNPSGGGAGISLTCVKPLFVPNCDTAHTAPTNPLCPGGIQGYFVDPTTGAIENPNLYPLGIIGEPWTLHQNSVPSQYGELDFSGGGGAAYRDNLAGCFADSSFGCNSTINLLTGKKVGPTNQGIRTLIHANGDGLGQGQDSIDTSKGLPFVITGGFNNPNPTLRGVIGISSSDSMATIPMYDGHQLCPGKSCGATVNIIGYMQMFITQVNGSDVSAIILNVAGCSSGVGGGGGVIGGGGASTIPVRLVSK